MKPYINIIIFIALLVACISCHHSTTQDILLQQANSLIQVAPDSSLCLLKKIKQPELMNKRKRAEYALLLTQAIDKCYLEHKTDSLILTAVNFYKQQSDKNQKAKSYFYLGRVYQDNNNILGAIKAYLNAIEMLPTNKDLKVLIYDNLAACYKEQNQYEKAMEMYKKSYFISSLQKEDNTILHSIRGIASIYSLQDSLQIALDYYQKALLLLENENDSMWTSTIYCDMARVYEANGKYIIAQKYINQSLKNTPTHDNLSVNYYWKGKILYQLNRYDSASYYFKKALEKSELNTQASIYNSLYNINKKIGNYPKALLYNDTAIVLYDSIQNLIHETEINNILKDHSLKMHKQQLTAQHKKNISIIASLTTFCLLLIMLLSMYINNKNKKKQICLQQKLIKLQTEKAALGNELRLLMQTHEYTEQSNQEMQIKLFDLWTQTLQICTRLFQTTPSYKKIISVETTKWKKYKDVLPQEDIATIQKEVQNTFAEAFQGLKDMNVYLTSEDLLYCTFSYLNLPNDTIKRYMRVESTQAITQRKYRIKKQLSPQIFQFIFSSDTPNCPNMK